MRNNFFSMIGIPVLTIVSLVHGIEFTDRSYGDENRAAPGSFNMSKPSCRECHSDLIDKSVVHAPAHDGCEACHKVNLSEHPGNASDNFFLVANTPELCCNCHKDMKTEIDALPHQHSAVKEEKNCMNCHSPHASGEQKLLVANKTEICLKCHDTELTANGRKLKNIKQLLSKSKVMHTGLRGGCTTCHQAHGSENNFLLINSYSPEFYPSATAEPFALCFECHDPDLLGLPNTTLVTNFRNGERNLHFAHNSEKKQRNCNVCHNVHASNNQYIINEEVVFGNWKFKMNFIPNEDGGSCSPGCHQTEVYRR